MRRWCVRTSPEARLSERGGTLPEKRTRGDSPPSGGDGREGVLSIVHDEAQTAASLHHSAYTEALTSRACPPNAASRRMALSRAKKPAARRPARTPQDVVLRITLEDIEPPIWREIALPDSTTLPELHRAIQIAFQWYDYHLHQFTIGEKRYTIPDEELDDFGVPARSASQWRSQQPAADLPSIRRQ